MKDNTYLRFRWSHRGVLHRRLVKIYNRALARVPFDVKYSVGARVRRRKPPYCFVEPDAVVVQVGAPKDTLDAGRSRAMHFALRTGGGGKLVVVEPDTESVARFRALAARHGLDHVVVHEGGAWSERATLRLWVDPSHPATNFVEGCADYTDEQTTMFVPVAIEADSLDAILARIGTGRVDLVSITTNGAEQRILEGLRATRALGLRYICLARTSELNSFLPMMTELGYEFLTHDDRGYTFRQLDKTDP